MSGTDHNKWVMFKNYMHNELGITKEDIKKWTEDAVMKVATDYINNHASDFSFSQEALVNKAVEKMLNDEMGPRFGSFRNNKFKEDIVKEVSKRLTIDIKPLHQQVADSIVGTA